MSTLLPEDIIPDNDQTRARGAHLEEIKNLVGNAYPNKFSRTNVVEKLQRERKDLVTSIEGEDTITSVVGQFQKYVPETGERPTPEQLEAANAELDKFVVRVSGRIQTPPRVMGKAAFVHLSDGRERLQIYVRKQEARAISNDSGQPVEEDESGWKLFGLLDHGDFIGVEGPLFVTKSGELSVHVRTLQFLSKALVPMPDKLHGISDPEIRQRQRYADLIASSLKVETDDEQQTEGEDKTRELSTREVFERRSKIIREMRRHLDDHGYIEVETPMLSPIASGAAARPFETFHKALGIPLYLRVAPELYLKRLLVGGFERVYELNRNFRNEGISTRHNPEFTMLEFYTAYKDVNWMMDFCEEMLRETIKKVTGKSVLRLKRDSWIYTLFGLEAPPDTIEIDVEKKFKRISMREAICEYWNSFAVSAYSEAFSIGDISPEWLENTYNVGLLVSATKILLVSVPFETKTYFLKPRASVDSKAMDDLHKKEADIDQIRSVILSGIPLLQDEIQVSTAIEFLFEEIVEKHLTNPTFIIDYPKVISPLSKASPDNPAIAERFELFIDGMEVANGFSELNDPEEQYQRFKEQTEQRERGDEEAMRMDEDYVKALSYGMPPAAGIGIGIDRLTMLLTNRRSIRDVILFPHMRPARQASEEQPPESEPEAKSSDS